MGMTISWGDHGSQEFDWQFPLYMGQAPDWSWKSVRMHFLFSHRAWQNEEWVVDNVCLTEWPLGDVQFAENVETSWHGLMLRDTPVTAASTIQW